jgi:hypothetical protein
MTVKTELCEDMNKDIHGEAVQVVEWLELVGSHGYWSTGAAHGDMTEGIR